MSRIKNESLLQDVIAAFNSILGVTGRTFGANSKDFRGVSDNAKGVQWNIAVNRKDGATRLGVNLEGIKYKNWPIATFIENERETIASLSLSKRIPEVDRIVVGFYRDAWQCAYRPTIAERHIGKSEIPLSHLTKQVWIQMLDEAYACLDEKRGYRGRAMQFVTRSTGEAEMTVSPHLNIHTYINTKTASLRADMESAFSRLKPIYELVRRRSQNSTRPLLPSVQ